MILRDLQQARSPEAVEDGATRALVAGFSQTAVVAASQLSAEHVARLGRRVRRNESERWFEAYLRQTGHGGWDRHEPDLGVPVRPDYLVEKAGHSAVVEVKEFVGSDYLHAQNAAFAAGESVYESSGTDALNLVRRKINRAAKKLVKLKEYGRPLVVLLVNPRGLDISGVLWPTQVLWAMYGDPSPGAVTGRNGELSAQHSYLSAIVLLRRHPSWQAVYGPWRRDHATGIEGYLVQRDEFFVQVFHTAAAQTGQAVAVSPEIFDGPHDQHWYTAFDNNRLVQRRGPERWLGYPEAPD
ncbi:hypothetical protein [Solirubrobacter soli]|uniref:hypothetical protein n=1 Tax=Solirubrobacter soli TaxID=363832 RepID=UPI0012FB8757|nr:hypothetical protein [Solirubrobacter soli]